MIGRTILHYQIVETLGRGGMGVVYKARDTHLDRFVAIKVLPPERVADPERKRRFVQEAKAASALNHSNIVHIYDIAEAEGIQFIAMEYVPGKTLDEMAGRKGLRLNETLKYAIQIADALSKAHGAGIVHRDLKPSNIMVTNDGMVKVLDFGLAKLTDRTSGELVETATIRADEAPETAEGTIVGTVAYMSPEQAEGKPVDARSDLFAFGSLLYEMITGRRAFHGDSKLSTLSAILKEEPKPISAAVADAPRDLEKIIARCLRKDPARRFQHTDDLKIALAELKEESDSGLAVTAQTGEHRGRRKVRLVWMSTSFVFVALLGLWLWRPTQTVRPAPKVVPLTSYPGQETSPSFSPDGNQVAFAWNGVESAPTKGNFHIYLKLIAGSEPVRLTHDTADEFAPAWSPDGSYVGFLRILSPERAGVFVIPAIGGRERKLTDIFNPGKEAPYFGRFLSWFPDGKWLVVVDKPSPEEPGALFLISVESGDKARLTSPPDKSWGDGSPAVSPDGRAVVFARFVEENVGDLFLLEISQNLAPRGEPTRLTLENRYSETPAWTPDGRAIVFSSGPSHTPGLWEMARPRPGERTAKPERLAFAGDGAEQPAISRRGQLAYTQTTLDVDVWRLDLNGGRPSEKAATDLISSTRIEHDARYSPDGKRIVFGSNRSGSFEIWVCNSDGSGQVQLTSFASTYYAAGARWSPDGRFIYFNYNPNGKPGVYVIGSEGGSPRSLGVERLEGVSRDGKWLYLSSTRSGKEQIWRMPANGGDAIQVTKRGGDTALESSDGRYLYYLRAGALWRVPLAGGEETQVLASVFHDNYAVVDRGVYFIPDAKPFSVQFLSFDTGKIATIAKIPREPAFGFSVSPDGRSLLFAEFEAVRSDLMLVENFR